MEAIKESLKWLILGGSGQLGSELVAQLESCKSRYLAPKSGELDISKPEVVKKYISAYKPDVVVNAAAWTDVDGAETHPSAATQVNALGPKAIAEACRSVRVKFFQISTDYVFSGDANWPLEVNDAKLPKSVYGRTKSEGEDYVRSIYPEGSYILRTAWLYSRFGKNFAKTIVRIALQDENERQVVDDQYGQPTSARDLAKQIVLSVEIGIKPGIYHATNSGQATWNEFAKEIFGLLREDPKRVVSQKSADLNRLAPRPTFSVLSHKCWENSGVSPMRDWHISLAEQIDEIKTAVVAEEL